MLSTGGTDARRLRHRQFEPVRVEVAHTLVFGGAAFVVLGRVRPAQSRLRHPMMPIGVLRSRACSPRAWSGD